jgi:hypothetical protein
MASTISTSHTSQAAAVTPSGRRLQRLRRHLKLLVGLLAVYAPPALVVQLHRTPLAKVYLVLGVWAIEWIVWYWLDGRVLSRRRGQDPASWSPER